MDSDKINDIRESSDFRNISFSGFQKIKVKNELAKSIYNGKLEHSLNWSIELICSGHFLDLWEVIILVSCKFIHVGNPKLLPYINLRYSNFKEILNNGYMDSELNLRNNNKIRNLFAEIIIILILSPKKHTIELIKIPLEEFDISNIYYKLTADNVHYINNIFRENDPKQLFIPLNEFAYNLFNNNTLLACYWLEWILQFEKNCKSKKIYLIAESRTFVDLPNNFQKDTIWIIWEIIKIKINTIEQYNKIINQYH